MKIMNKKKRIEMFHVDSFTKQWFKGNPAIVCILEELIDEDLMQKIAFEANLSETAFLIPKVKSEEKSNEYDIRWFTPKKEVSLCGHATLAASKILFDYKKIPFDEIIYHSKSGILKSKRDILGISLDFPLDEVEQISSKQYDELLDALGIQSYENIFVGKTTKKLVIHLNNKKEVLNLCPDFEKMKRLNTDGIKGVGITSIDDGKFHFITRYFNPWVGVNEDPVTGSVHTLLASYWFSILGIQELKSYQASYRGGEITLRIKDKKRLEIIGEARIVFGGELYLDYDNYR